MASIEFTGIRDDQTLAMAAVFNLIAEGKLKGTIDEVALKEVLGELYNTKFIHTKVESDYWLERWKFNPNVEAPWDFGSWVDAFINADIELRELKFIDHSSGKITLLQLACPSGGIDATEEIVRIFGGRITANHAI
ncbi:hypothetical protein [Jeongeupia chitinilytica]|uniref:Uncharacterized protein n=1 Tax=Jeongeupia chitinilytica TaxID=1041641 RepID=A0ABQ3GWE4_9NEIS|nr:hypothetical protein [Jeongeupia chitinilytica]GHD58443.1 hypothetical protein GCM10007350_08320 [Jeongeupia chitinilytica]